MSDAQEIEDTLNDAIRDALSRHGIVTIRHLVIAEGLDSDDSERALWMTHSEGLTRWDSIGMLTHALHVEQAATIREANQ